MVQELNDRKTLEQILAMADGQGGVMTVRTDIAPYQWTFVQGRSVALVEKNVLVLGLDILLEDGPLKIPYRRLDQIEVVIVPLGVGGISYTYQVKKGVFEITFDLIGWITGWILRPFARRSVE